MIAPTSLQMCWWYSHLLSQFTGWWRKTSSRPQGRVRGIRNPPPSLLIIPANFETAGSHITYKLADYFLIMTFDLKKAVFRVKVLRGNSNPRRNKGDGEWNSEMFCNKIQPDSRAKFAHLSLYVIFAFLTGNCPLFASWPKLITSEQTGRTPATKEFNR